MYGFEGGTVVKVNEQYHLFTSEMIGEPMWVKMQLAHWASEDKINFQRISTLYTSSGEYEGLDARAALWSPMPNFNAKEDRWNLTYVAYHCAPDSEFEMRRNHKGRIWRAVSQKSGIDGIGGPYVDTGIIMQPGPDSDTWEGLMGTDSFYPYEVDGQWFAFYGSAHTQKLPIAWWGVGLAQASELSGPWRRRSASNPV